MFLKPKDGAVFRPGDRPEFVADIINGKPPFRYKVFWNEGFDDKKNALTPEETTKYYKIKFKLPERFRDLKIPESDEVLQKKYWHEGKQDHYKISIMLYDSTKRASTYDYRVWGAAIPPDCAIDSVTIIVSAREVTRVVPTAEMPTLELGKKKGLSEDEIKTVPERPGEAATEVEKPKEDKEEKEGVKTVPERPAAARPEEEKTEVGSTPTAPPADEHEKTLEEIDKILAEHKADEEGHSTVPISKPSSEEKLHVFFSHPTKEDRENVREVYLGEQINTEDKEDLPGWQQSIERWYKTKMAAPFYFTISKNQTRNLTGKVKLDLNLYKISKHRAKGEAFDGKGDLWITPKKWSFFAKIGSKDWNKIRPNHLIDIPVIKAGNTEVDVFPRFTCPKDAKKGDYYLLATLVHEEKGREPVTLDQTWIEFAVGESESERPPE